MDILDIAKLASSFNDSSEQTGFDKMIDLNNDNIIDIFDLVILSKNFNKATMALFEIDKPSSIEVDKSFVLTPVGVGTNTVLYQYRIKYVEAKYTLEEMTDMEYEKSTRFF